MTRGDAPPRRGSEPPIGPRPAFVACYAASGGAALVYEVTWTRLFTLHMGHTVGAASTVLAAFMGGLAAGAWLAGRRLPPPGSRLRSYAALETAVAATALGIPIALRALTPVLAAAYADGAAPTRFAVVRVLLSLALLLVPTAAMGATFPVAAAWFSVDARRRRTRLPSQSATRTGLLYAANTAGAAAGAIAAGFWLLPSFGIRATTIAGVMLNGAAAACAWWLARTEGADTEVSDVPAAPSPPATRRKRVTSALRPLPRPESEPQPRLASAAAMLCGFVGLVYEIAFTRLLAVVVGPTTYAFTMMTASFIFGIALGSAAATASIGRITRPVLWLAAMMILAATAASAAASYAASSLPLIVAAQAAAPGATFESLVFRQGIAVGALLLPLTIALGAAFPFALATAASGSVEAAGPDAARVYTANTIGAIAGALAAGFALVPQLGLQGTFVMTGRLGVVGGSLMAGAWLASLPSGRSRRLASLAAVALAAVPAMLLVGIRQWDRDLLSSGGYKYAPYIGADAASLDASLRAGVLEFYEEGAVATVSVRRLGGKRALAIDGKIDASDAGDMLTQRLLGVLPMLMHRDPREVCIIGLGSGVTAASALAAGGARRIDIVEIAPEVVPASALFAKENAGVLGAPQVHVILEDGRSHLQLTTRKYDVIVSEPSNPWIAGIAALFTREFFAAARAHLSRGGILCQWTHTYDMSAEDLQSIVLTFAKVFPQATMWLVGEGDLLLVGSLDDTVDGALTTLAAHASEASKVASLADVAVTPSAAVFDLMSLFAGGPAELARYGAEAAEQTDDRMALEFTAPRRIYGRSTNENTAAVRGLASDERLPSAVAAVMRGADARSWRARGQMDLRAEAYATAYASFRRAVALDSRDVDALRGVSDAAGGAGRQEDERAWLEALARAEPTNAAVHVELSHVRAAAGDYDGAAAVADDARRLAPDDPRPIEQLASVLADMSDGQRLEPVAGELVARFPGREDGHYYQAAALFLRGRIDEAVAAAQRLVETSPRSAKAQNLLGAACANAGRRECAGAAFQAAIQLNPRDSSAYVNLGQLRLQSADPAAAAESFGEAIAIDPTASAAMNGLARARAALARP